jgi:TonB family protein
VTLRIVLLGVALLLAGCEQKPPAANPEIASDPDSPARGFEAPVMVNSEPPVHYPPVLFQKNIEGTVLLRLFVDSLGRLAPESTRIAEGSGVAALDSAARAAVPAMKFAPARRNGRPISTLFLQPIEFHRPERPTRESEH